jgi:hypothetical protein
MPPADNKNAGAAWIEEWQGRLQDAGLSLLKDETDRIRRVTHRVGSMGKELIFMKP